MLQIGRLPLCWSSQALEATVVRHHGCVVSDVSPLRHEVPGDIEDDLSSRPGSRSGIGNRESASATKSHGDRVGPIVVEGEVQGRGGRVVHSDRADREIAEVGLLGDRQVPLPRGARGITPI